MTAPAFARPSPFVGNSPRMREVYRAVEKLGRCTAPVLLLGETGTGKEIVARAIHTAGPGGPFIPVDCSAVPAALIESELFGHLRGAFTGAVAAKPGLLELASGGTAFFDEIGDLLLEVQVKLLRVLQDKEFRRVGSTEYRRANFRAIAATHRDLKREIECGRFRQDLYYRLNVVTLRLPPLRERKEDIPALVECFLSRYPRRYKLAPGLLEVMLAYDWPGNVRELENCIERMVAMTSGDELDADSLSSEILLGLCAEEMLASWYGAEMSAPGGDPEYQLRRPSCPLSMHEVEKRVILEAVARAKGNHLEAARRLGIGKTTLYRKLKEYAVAS